MEENADLNTRSGRRLHVWLGVLGLMSAIIGILPWLVGQFTSESPPPQKPQAVLVLRKIAISEKNAGKQWDDDEGLPDLLIRVENLTTRSRMEVPTQRDTLIADLNAKTVQVREGNRIRIQIWDQDAWNRDDKVGEITFQVTQARLKKKTEELQFQKVKSLQLSFELQ